MELQFTGFFFYFYLFLFIYSLISLTGKQSTLLHSWIQHSLQAGKEERLFKTPPKKQGKTKHFVTPVL